jgi:hypothetical protein
MSLELARKVADAVLYEGYVLYPYRASAAKNTVRWQFGVVAPRAYVEAGGSDSWAMQTECLVESRAEAVVDVRVRFLQLQARSVEEAAAHGAFRPVERLEVDGRILVTWDEACERDVTLSGLGVADLLGGERVVPFEIPGGEEPELLRDAAGVLKGRIIRRRWPVAGCLRLQAEGPGPALKLRVRIENVGDWPADAAPARDHALRHALLGAHTILGVRGGSFLSLLEPPDWAAAAAASCANQNTWPVLVGAEGSSEALLSSPIILYDYPAVAPESPGDLCDATEIDEILTLRVLTLTDEEKREARATDERARQIVDRSESLPPAAMEKLHGTMRSSRAEGGQEAVRIGDALVAKGHRVRLHPRRRADAMDMFLVDRAARVEGVFRDVDGMTYVAVTVEDDPAADLHSWYGRFFYFYPEEVEPL